MVLKVVICFEIMKLIKLLACSFIYRFMVFTNIVALAYFSSPLGNCVAPMLNDKY